MAEAPGGAPRSKRGGEMPATTAGGAQGRTVGVRIERAAAGCAGGIAAVIEANRSDPSIFLRGERDVRRRIDEFAVALDPTGRVVGCAALHAWSSVLGEILSVAVEPAHQGRGLGRRLLEDRLGRARELGLERVWLSTTKPGYFGRLGFVAISWRRLPPRVLLGKLGAVARQPPGRIAGALLGRYTFMERVVGTEAAAHSVARARPALPSGRGA